MSEVMDSAVVAGGWSEYTAEITPDQQNVFNQAMEGVLGVHYTPVAVSQQVVAGMNYRFFCNAQGVYPGAEAEAAIVSIYAGINEQPVVTGIERITR